MKKTYIAPRVKDIHVAEEKMICASDPKVLNSTLDSSAAESRGNNWIDDEAGACGQNLWDDEE